MNALCRVTILGPLTFCQLSTEIGNPVTALAKSKMRSLGTPVQKSQNTPLSAKTAPLMSLYPSVDVLVWSPPWTLAA